MNEEESKLLKETQSRVMGAILDWAVCDEEPMQIASSYSDGIFMAMVFDETQAVIAKSSIHGGDNVQVLNLIEGDKDFVAKWLDASKSKPLEDCITLPPSYGIY